MTINMTRVSLLKPYVNFTWETDLKKYNQYVSFGVTSKLSYLSQAKNDLISPTLGYIEWTQWQKNLPIDLNSQHTYVQANISIHIFVSKTKILFVF